MPTQLEGPRLPLALKTSRGKSHQLPLENKSKADATSAYKAPRVSLLFRPCFFRTIVTFSQWISGPTSEPPTWRFRRGREIMIELYHVCRKASEIKLDIFVTRRRLESGIESGTTFFCSSFAARCNFFFPVGTMFYYPRYGVACTASLENSVV